MNVWYLSLMGLENFADVDEMCGEDVDDQYDDEDECLDGELGFGHFLVG